MVTLHVEPVCVRYRANQLSCAACWTLFYWVVVLVVPYIVAYVTGGLWSREVIGREQPAVRFRQEALLEAYTTRTSLPLVKLGWSTSSEINSAFGDELRPSELRTWTEDDDRDGRVETLAFQLRVPLAAGERMHSISLMLGFDVIFDRATSLRMNSSIFVQHSSPLPGLRSAQSADLVLVSEQALRGKDRVQRAPCKEPLWMLQVRLLPTEGAPARHWRRGLKKVVAGIGGHGLLVNEPAHALTLCAAPSCVRTDTRRTGWHTCDN